MVDGEANEGDAAVPLTGGFAVLAALQISSVQVAPVPARGRTEPAYRQTGAVPQLTSTPWTLRVGPQRPDLVRYNRVEALSLGVRGQLRPATPVGPLSLTATARFGIGDLHPNGRVDVAHESVERRIVVSGYHELTAVEGQPRPLGPANSLTALLWGRDLGDYYRRTGASVELTPPLARPTSYRLRVFAERQQGVEKETDVQLPRLFDDGRRFRPNLAAEDGWAFGGTLELDVRTGTDPTRARGGVQASLEAAWGDFEYRRAALGASRIFALPARMSLGVEVATGAAWGEPPTQRTWYVGGPLTLRGYAPLAAGGDVFWRARLELDRRYAFGRVLVFSDAGWARPEEGGSAGLDLADALYSVGAGLALVDGIVRIDGAWPLEEPGDFRLDVYLGQIS